jgi:hypothetical protein
MKPPRSPKITIKAKERKIEAQVVIIKYLEYTQEIDALMQQLNV